MAFYNKVHLSESAGGQPIKISATAGQGQGTLIHTSGTSSSDIDEVWIYANNTSASAVKLTIEFGGTTSPDNEIEINLDAESGLVLVIPGLILSGDGTSGRTISAFAGTSNVINISGYINRIS